MEKIRIMAADYIGGIIGSVVGAIIFVVWMFRHHDAVDCLTRLESIVDENGAQIDKLVIFIGAASILIVYGLYGMTTAIIFAVVNAVLGEILDKIREKKES